MAIFHFITFSKFSRLQIYRIDISRFREVKNYKDFSKNLEKSWADKCFIFLKNLRWQDFYDHHYESNMIWEKNFTKTNSVHSWSTIQASHSKPWGSNLLSPILPLHIKVHLSPIQTVCMKRSTHLSKNNFWSSISIFTANILQESYESGLRKFVTARF